MNRNLKDDLEVVEKARQFTKIMGWGSKEFHELSPYFSKFHEEGLDIAKHAIERALKAEKALGNETILNGRALAKLNERAEKAETLVRELVEALKKAHEYIGDINSFYGQGLQVHGWHFNGAPEPLDNFIDDNGGCEVEEFVGRVLTKAKEVLGDE